MAKRTAQPMPVLNVPPTVQDRALYDFLMSLKENIEVLLGQRSALSEKAAVTQAQLSDIINKNSLTT